MRAAFSLAEAPSGDPGLVEPVMIALAAGVTAAFFDSAPVAAGAGRARARLTCLLDGAPAAPPFICSSFDLTDGGSRRLALLGLPLASLLDRRLVLALDGRAEAMADPAWLQPPVRETPAMVERLTPEARLRLLRLLLGSAASLFLRARPAYPGMVRDILTLCGVEALEPVAQTAFGDHRILTYRLSTAAEGDAVALTPSRIWPLKGASFHHEAAAGLLHMHLPIRLGAEGEAVILGERPLRLSGAPEGLAAHPPARWSQGRDAGALGWLSERLRLAAGESPALAAAAREMQAGAAQPALSLRHLSATPAGIVYALELADPEGFVRAVRIERGAGRIEIAPRMRLDGAGTLAGFAPLPGGAGEACRISLIHHSGRLRPAQEGEPAAYDGSIPAGFAAALAEERAAGLAGGAVEALADARASLPPRETPVQIQAFGTLERPALTLLAPAGANPDLARARAAMIFAEAGRAGVEVLLTVAEGEQAQALRRIVAETAAIHGVAHRILTLAPSARPAEALLAGLRASRGGGVLLLGADALPEGRGWLAAWRRRLDRGGMVGGVLIGPDGAIAHAGEARLAGCPRSLAPRKARRASRAFTEEAAGFSRDAIGRLMAMEISCADPQALLAEFARRERAAGHAAVTDFHCAVKRYAYPVPQDAFAAELQGVELARIWRGAAC